MTYIKEKAVIIGGIWLIVLPYTGFPSSWKKFFTVVTGVLFLYLGLLMYKRVVGADREKNKEIKTQTFTETV